MVGTPTGVATLDTATRGTVVIISEELGLSTRLDLSIVSCPVKSCCGSVDLLDDTEAVVLVRLEFLELVEASEALLTELKGGCSSSVCISVNETTCAVGTVPSGSNACKILIFYIIITSFYIGIPV